MPRLLYAILCLLAVLAAGCNDSGDIQLTLVSENVALSTQIADIRSTATYAADKLQQTAEFVGTGVVQGDRENELLAITLTASGIDASLVTPGAPVPTLTPALSAPGAASNNAPLTTQDVVSGTAPDTALMTATPAAPPSLYNIVTAEGVGSNDCALGSVSNFTSSTAEIYVVATAANIPPNTKLSSQWFIEGTPVVSHDFTPDFAIEQNCIWFFIDQSDTPFTPGNWSVQLAINDTPAAPPVPFTITG